LPRTCLDILWAIGYQLTASHGNNVDNDRNDQNASKVVRIVTKVFKKIHFHYNFSNLVVRG